MRPVTVVVLSRFRDIFDVFREALEEHEPEARKIVVRDSHQIPDSIPGWDVIDGRVPFSFSANANVGIQAAGSSDILLCNDDAILTEPLIEPLQKAAYHNARIGIVSPKIDGLCNMNLQRYGVALPRDPCPMVKVAFVCVYLKREMIDEIGLMDDGFSCSYEDDDYCMRARVSGWDVVVTSLASVRHGLDREHGGSETLRRVFPGGYYDVMPVNRARFIEKWGKLI